MNTQTGNPFVGLRPFESDESLLFFGRQEQVMELMQRLHDHHFVAVIGSSGSGKSSLIRAGLVPRLKAGYLVNDRDHWMIATMKPGQKPLHNLADGVLGALNGKVDHAKTASLLQKIKEEGADALINVFASVFQQKNASLFILVDQFEELFRFSSQSEQKDEAIDFVNILLELANDASLPVYIVITMRSDFIGDCDQFFGLPEALNKSQYLVPRLNRIQLKTVIEGPVKLCGGKINPALTAKLLNGISQTKDELPVLQHTLMRIWDQEHKHDNNGELDLGDYEVIGGISKALSNHAEEALHGMSEKELALAKKIFQSLTTVDDNGRKIRRPAKLSDLIAITDSDKASILQLIDKFNSDKRSFLIVSPLHDEDDVMIDISHESLIRQWERLNDWADDEGEAAKIYLQLVASAKLHKSKRKDLLTGSELQIGLLWHKDFQPKSEWAKKYDQHFPEAMQYLQKSKEAEAKTVSEKKNQKRNRILLMSGIFILLIASAFLVFKVKDDNKKDEALRLVKQAYEMVPINPTVALQLAGEAMKKHNDNIMETVAKNIYDHNIFYRTVLKADSGTIVAVSTKYELLATVDRTNTEIWDMTGKKVGELPASPRPITAICFAPASKIVAIGDVAGNVYWWDIEKNTKIDSAVIENKDTIRSLEFSPSGEFVLARSSEIIEVFGKNNSYLEDTDANRVAFMGDETIVLSNMLDFRFLGRKGNVNEQLDKIAERSMSFSNGELVNFYCDLPDSLIFASFEEKNTSIVDLKYYSKTELYTRSPIQSCVRIPNYIPTSYETIVNDITDTAFLQFKFDDLFKCYLTGSRNGEIIMWLLDQVGTMSLEEQVDVKYNPHMLLHIPGNGHAVKSLIMLNDNNSFLAIFENSEVRKFTFVNNFYNISKGGKWDMPIDKFLESDLIDHLSKEQVDAFLKNKR